MNAPDEPEWQALMVKADHECLSGDSVVEKVGDSIEGREKLAMSEVARLVNESAWWESWVVEGCQMISRRGTNIAMVLVESTVLCRPQHAHVDQGLGVRFLSLSHLLQIDQRHSPYATMAIYLLGSQPSIRKLVNIFRLFPSCLGGLNRDGGL
jgi:hypothetical protein